MPPSSATPPQTSSVAIEAFVRLVRAGIAVTRELSAQLNEDHGLTINEYEALLLLARAPDSRLRRVDLANRLLLTASGVTRLLDGLERAGYVEKRSCDSDARVTYAALTAAGLQKLQEASGDHIAAVRELFEVRFSGPELEKLAELLGRLPEAAAAADSCSP